MPSTTDYDASGRAHHGHGRPGAGHAHAHSDEGHDHSHGLIDPSIKRSRRGIRAVGLSLAVLSATAVGQAVVYVASGSVALLADLIHNGGDALTAVPVGIAFGLRSALAEQRAGRAVVGAIFVSACIAGVIAVEKLIHPAAPTHLVVLAVAGGVGFLGNELAAQVRQPGAASSAPPSSPTGTMPASTAS